MELEWTSKVRFDLARLYEFLAPINKPPTMRIVQSLTAAANNLIANPRIGESLEAFQPDEIRRIIVGQYEMRYQIRDATISDFLIPQEIDLALTAHASM